MNVDVISLFIRLTRKDLLHGSNMDTPIKAKGVMTHLVGKGDELKDVAIGTFTNQIITLQH